MLFFKTIFFILLIFLQCKSSLEPLLRKEPSLVEIKPSSVKFFNEVLPSLRKKNVLLVTNPSGIGSNPEKLMKQFKEKEVKIKYLLGLEHGFLGLEEDFISTPVTIDSIFNVPIYHVYKLKSFDLQLLISGVDAIVFDVQDMGMRCYTYLTVIKRLLDQVPNQKLEFYVLDHVSPGMEVLASGEEMKSSNENFAGEFPTLFFSGHTIGESALFYNSEFLNNKVNLKVLPVENYKRGMYFEKTGLVWNTPSPNLPTLDSARNYLSLVLLEGVNVSVGRGTQAPFIYFGSPYFKDAEDLANELNQNSKDEYYFQPIFFKPFFGPYKDKICRGLRLTIVKLNYNPIELSYTLIKAIYDKYRKDFKWTGWGQTITIDHLWGTDHFRKSIEAGKTYSQFHQKFEKLELEYREKNKKYNLY